MLQQVCEYLNNFDFNKGQDTHTGTFTIEGGSLPLSFLKDKQRFLIVGSDLNDGMYTYHANGIKNDDDTTAVGLQDETWTGTICALAVPPAVIALSGEIKAWVDANGAVVNSPYTSENVLGVYSYTKASGGSGAGGSVTWQDTFRNQLKRWKKVSF